MEKRTLTPSIPDWGETGVGESAPTANRCKLNRAAALASFICAASLIGGCSDPSDHYDRVLFDTGTALLRAHDKSRVMMKVGNLFKEASDGVCIVRTGEVATLERNSDARFHSLIPEVVNQTRVFSPEEDWFVVNISGSHVERVYRISGWYSRVTISFRTRSGDVGNQDGCFSATDTAEIEEIVLNGKNGLAITLSGAGSS
jgi:hypothetical protein